MRPNEVPDLPTDFLARLDHEDLSIPELLGLILHAHGRPLDLDRRGPGRDVDSRTRKGESR